MEQQKLPNVTIALVLGIISFIACCCSMGIGGLVLSGIAFYLVTKDQKLYLENPELYGNYSQLKTARIIAIIGLALAAIAFLFSIYQIVSAGGWASYNEQQMEQLRELGFPME
ncbi:DUF4190 domain-containing protein [Dokdonia sinensis]|uniref:DUF4190 domain-containing protein n=1 Tax=Dokdonia sinensis TaxID=2479847 RepID=A0A3M0GIH0_9FLAO|nr:CCC motif membrane protein [Dokdonia sinensis]RMB64068.1 DUF4190 domain-containing protein [Dokdonia sinensis]